MPKLTLSILWLVLMSCVALSQTAPAQVEINLKHNDQREQQSKQQLERLFSVYDLSPWSYTRKIIIDSDFNTIPHSHPVLTLHTRHLKDDELLLSTFVHEQLHWYLSQKREGTEAAVKELRSVFPKVPVGFPEGGDSEESSYEHLLVCYLEYVTDKQLLGELKTKQVMEFWASDHYTWIYRTVLEQGGKINAVVRRQKLMPIRRA